MLKQDLRKENIVIRSLLERETTIVFNDAEEKAMIWSASPNFQRRMAKLRIEPNQRDGEGRWYTADKKLFFPKKKSIQNLNQEEREVRRARMLKIRREASEKHGNLAP